MTQHLLVLLAADMEQAIKECIKLKAKLGTNESIIEYVDSTLRRVIQGIQKESIAGIVGYFGVEAKKRFDEYLADKEQEVNRYGNAIRRRNNVAHSSGTQVTFGELKLAVKAAETIHLAVLCALEIDPISISGDVSTDE